MTQDELIRLLELFAADNPEMNRQLKLEREHQRNILAWRKRGLPHRMGTPDRETGEEKEIPNT